MGGGEEGGARVGGWGVGGYQDERMPVQVSGHDAYIPLAQARMSTTCNENSGTTRCE